MWCKQIGSGFGLWFGVKLAERKFIVVAEDMETCMAQTSLVTENTSLIVEATDVNSEHTVLAGLNTLI